MVTAPLSTSLAIAVFATVLVFSVAVLGVAWVRGRMGDAPRAGVPPAGAPAEVDAWVSTASGEVTVVLSTTWADPAVDAESDARLNDALGLRGADRLGFCWLRVFNAGSAEASVALPEGAIRATGPDGATASLRDLSGVLDRAAAEGRSGAPSQVETLRLLGAGAGGGPLTVPAGSVAGRPIAFPAVVDLRAAARVEWTDGRAFERRRIPGARWARLLSQPSLDDLRRL